MPADLGSFLQHLFLQKPYALLAWPVVAMLAGVLLRGLLGPVTQRLAIVPRTPSGLVGVATAPLLHANAAHLAANLPAFVVLGALVLRRGSETFIETAVIITLGAGILVWLLGRRGAHQGASGVVFGFLGYLLGVGWFLRTTTNLLIAGAVLVFYGGLLAGLKPARSRTSWEAHLFGFAVGLAKVWWLRR